ncbi:hypothetical protein E2C01_043111 [Portunus trituberculatus]|uniref:Uncharacterized protein n=1 Tax=Portunus trituberculatus TaxID=210409 RepID=A0A5B7FWE0_PORTR|nr:hypothetical protein [Portunus trituberculatus]
MLFCEHKCIHKTVTPPPEVVFSAISESNLIATLSPSLQAFMGAILRQEVALTLLKNLGSSSRSSINRGWEQANHSEAVAFGPSPGKFKPRKFA